MERIGYPQVEELLKNYHTLKSYLLNLQTELATIYYGNNNEAISLDDILYSLSVGNRVISDMPHGSPSPGEKVLNIILNKDRMINDEIRHLINAINTFGEIVEKIDNAYVTLNDAEKILIRCRYYERMRWKEIYSLPDWYYTEDFTWEIRRNAVEKLVLLLRIKPEQYVFCMKCIKGSE